MRVTLKNIAIYLLCVISLFTLAVSTYRCITLLKHIEDIADLPNTQQSWLVSADMHLYLNAAHQYQTTGTMYERTDYYGPLAPVFKFPPAFQLQFLSLSTSADIQKFNKPLRIAISIGYALTCLALIGFIGRKVYKQHKSTTKALLFISLAGIAATSSTALQDCILLTNYEIPIFIFLTVSFFCLHKHPRLSALIIGYLASIKIYPAFMANLLFIKPERKTIATFFLSSALFTAAALFVFSRKENLFFFTQILPMLMSEKVAASMYSASFGGTIFGFTQDLELTQIIFQSYRFTFLIFSFLLLFRYRHHLHQLTLEVFALLMVLMLICLPNYWPSYLVILFPSICITARHIVIRTHSIISVIGLIAIASQLIEYQSFLHIGAPNWLANSHAMDDIGRGLIHTYEHHGITITLLKFSYHYPQTVFFYLLEQIKFITPAIFLLITAEEISLTSQDFLLTRNNKNRHEPH